MSEISWTAEQIKESIESILPEEDMARCVIRGNE